MLFNLLENAIEASPPNGVVRLTATVTGERLALTVQDEGPGIPADVRPHIFEPFFTTKEGRPDAGLGLGLSISHTLIASMGGTLALAPTTGPGTTFEITLPRRSPTNGGTI